MRSLFESVIVFGVFDLLHPGHVSFLEQASRVGKNLIVVVARDTTVQELKGKKPRGNERERVAHVRKELKDGVHVVLGDRKLGTYSAIKKYRPDCIALGYDQRALGRDLRKRMMKGMFPRIPLVRLRPHAPLVFHTSKLRLRR